MTRTTILLNDDLMLRVRQLARANGTTMTVIIRQALEAYVGQQQQGRILSFAGVGNSGRRSISKNAEEILRRKGDRRKGW
jgi:predicted transcriptional regulator